MLSGEALDFVGELHARFEPRRRELLTARRERAAELLRGGTLDFRPETREIREGDWRVAEPPPDFRDRRVEITGPTDRKLVINALNSGARGFMADFEDANSPTWANQVGGHVNLVDAIEGTIEYTSSEGKEYRLVDDPATLLVRPRGLHLPEKHLRIDGDPVSGALFDFGMHVFHGGRRLAERGRGVFFYLPKLEHHLEARWWDDAFRFAEEAFGLERGTLRATVADRDAAVGVPDGRDPVGAARPLARPQRRPLGLHLLDDQVLPRAARVRAARPRRREDDGAVHARLLRAAGEDVPRARRVRDGRDGGADPVAQGPGGERARDRRRARGQAARGGGRLRRHLGRASRRRARSRRRSSTRCSATEPNQIDRRRDDVSVAAADLLDAASTPGEITEEGLRNDVNVGFQYISFWLGGRGAAGINGLMEDAATAEISRSQIWQWVRHGKVTRERVREVLDEEMAAIRAEVGDEVWEKGRPEETRRIFEQVALGEEFPEFLTLPAYELLD